MIITPLRIQGTFKIELQPRRDDRGYFTRTWDESIAQQHNLATRWVQENQSHSTRVGTIRGLHFQNPPDAETKLIRVVRGAVWDVFVDLRKGSPTFATWDALELTEDNFIMAYIPKGCAHGFCTLKSDTTIAYKVDSYYAPQNEGGIRWDDPSLAIRWPATDPFLSPRDRALPLLEQYSPPS